MAAQAASAHTFNETALRATLQAIAQNSRATDLDIEQALEEGFARGIAQALTDGSMTRDEEERLRAFRDHLPWRTTQLARTPSGTWNGPRGSA